MLNMKAVFEALLPPGSLWQPAPDEGFDQFLTVSGENYDDIHDRLYALGSLRDPYKTPILSDLEKEYGVYSDDRLTDEVRRQQLAAIKYAKPGTASDSLLQAILRKAGFDVYVRRNHPPVDPADLLSTDYLLEAGEVDAFAGEPNAIAGLGGGELLVNGPIVETSIDYTAQANGGGMFADEPTAVAGYFDDVTYTPVTYAIPVDSERWPYIFFITGQSEEEWGWLDDWNAEYSTTGKWEDGIEGQLRKNTDATFVKSGIRSFELIATGDVASGGVNQLLTTAINMTTNPILGSCTVSGYYWGSGAGSLMAPYIYYYDPVLDTFILGQNGTSSVSEQSFSFNAPNGVSGIALAAGNGGFTFPATFFKSVFFDEILIELDSPARAEVPSEREAEFKRLILKYKPLDTWAGLLVDYV